MAEEKQRWLIDTYLWWREVGHNESVWNSIKLTIHCDIKPILLHPYYVLHMRWMRWRNKKLLKWFEEEKEKKEKKEQALKN